VDCLEERKGTLDTPRARRNGEIGRQIEQGAAVSSSVSARPSADGDERAPALVGTRRSTSTMAELRAVRTRRKSSARRMDASARSRGTTAARGRLPCGTTFRIACITRCRTRRAGARTLMRVASTRSHEAVVRGALGDCHLRHRRGSSRGAAHCQRAR